MKNEMRLNYLMSLQEDVRDEIKQRISQRDGFATQFLVACGSVITISFLDFHYAAFLIWLMPLVTLFYSLQILYSYVMHDSLTEFLRKHVEPEIAELLEIAPESRRNYFWETRCTFNRKLSETKYPGIRKKFFEIIICIMPVVAGLIFGLLCFFRVDGNGARMYPDGVIIGVAVGAFVFFETMAAYVKCRFSKNHRLDRWGKIDYIDKSRKNLFDIDKAVFLDRDGTIIIDKVQPKDKSQIEFFDDTFSALKALQDKGYLLIVITNQDGIKQKKLTEKQFTEFNKELLTQLKAHGVTIDAIYYSPHEANDKGDFSFKPKPGMLFRAAEDFELDLGKCYFIGDRYTDYIAACRAGVKPMYVETGLPENENNKLAEFFRTYNPVRYKNLSEAERDIPDPI